MPKFVPVVDTEKPASEREHDRQFDKHRHFDNPHKVDRGWQQGNVGWGVLGEFGSLSKDDSAQVVKRSEGGNKMVKNERGLWVKAKDIEEEVVIKSNGRGRGGGISVLDEIASRTIAAQRVERKPEHDGQFDDVEGSRDHHRTGKNDPRDRQDRRSRSRSPERRHGRDSRDRRRDGHDRDSGQDRRRSYSRSRSRSGDRQHRDRHRRRDDSRDRDRDRHRRSARSPSNDDRRRDNRQRSSHSDEDRDHDRDRDSTRKPSSSHTSRDVEQQDHQSSSAKAPKKDAAADLIEEMPAELMHSITAVQVINRFHEVYAKDTLFQSERLNDLTQLFAADAVIASLKTGAVYLSGKEAIRESFAKTMAGPTTISKRVYLERTEGNTITAAKGGAPVTFCLDFHRPGTAPGLGDKAKHSVLLYRCQAAHITRIYGMVDQEQLSAPEEVEKTQVLKSKVWGFVKSVVEKDWEKFDVDQEAHFHNYDRMEVWGLF